jgi:hypothetical protein
MHLVNFFLLLLVGHCAECLDPSFYSDDKGTIHFEAPSGVCFNQGQGGGIPVAGKGSTGSSSTGCTTTLLPSCPIWVGLNQSRTPVVDGELTVLTYGMEKLYNKWMPEFFHCVLQNEDGQNISTPLRSLTPIRDAPGYFINCSLPDADHWPLAKRKATVSVWFQRTVAVPFHGMPENKIVQLYVGWISYSRSGPTSGFVTVNGSLDIKAEGLSLNRMYNLTFKDKKNSVTAQSSPLSSQFISFPIPLWNRTNDKRTVVNSTLKLSSSKDGTIPFNGKAGGNFFIFYLCFNGLKDGDESDIDCGGSCAIACGNNQKCQKFTDCKVLKCIKGRCAGYETCLQHYNAGSRTDGTYSIVNASSASSERQVQCLMSLDGGGWRQINEQLVMRVSSRHARTTATFSLAKYGYDTKKFQFGDVYVNIEFAGELDDSHNYVYSYFNNVQIGSGFRNGVCNSNFVQVPSWPIKRTVNAQTFTLAGQPQGDVDINCGSGQTYGAYGVFRFSLIRFKVVPKTT